MSWLLTEHWPWWFGGPVFGILAALVWRLEGRFLAVSGSVGRVVDGEDASRRAMRQIAEQQPDALDEALLQATLEAFGEDEVEAARALSEANPEVPSVPLVGPSAPLSAHLTMLVMIAVGGLLSAMLSGAWQPAFGLGEAHAELVAPGASAIVVLLIGGIFVGLGTRTAGGCTTGHGLNGCARLLPSSFVATAAFFGTAIAVSFLLEALAS